MADGAEHLSTSSPIRTAAISELPVNSLSRNTCAVGVKRFTLTF